MRGPPSCRSLASGSGPKSLPRALVRARPELFRLALRQSRLAFALLRDDAGRPRAERPPLRDLPWGPRRSRPWHYAAWRAVRGARAARTAASGRGSSAPSASIAGSSAAGTRSVAGADRRGRGARGQLWALVGGDGFRDGGHQSENFDRAWQHIWRPESRPM